MVKDFENWLKKNTNLMESTISLYLNIIKRFLWQYNDISIENINDFVSKSFREKRTPYTRFAFKYFLSYLGRPNDYNSIVKTRYFPRKKPGVYLKKEDIFQIINLISKERYKIAALIQFLTGSRASEILRLKKDDFIQSENWLKIRIVGKGMKERIALIPSPYAEDIKKFLEKCSNEYPFLKGKTKNFNLLYQNNYRYYYQAVKDAATILGFKEFATHDFRRCFIEFAYAQIKDIRTVKELVGHRKIDTTYSYLKHELDEEKVKTILENLIA